MLLMNAFSQESLHHTLKVVNKVLRVRNVDVYKHPCNQERVTHNIIYRQVTEEEIHRLVKASPYQDHNANVGN